MKKLKKVLGIVVLVVISSSITFYIGRQIGLNTDTSTTTTTVENVTVGKQTIKKTLTSSGEIESATTEKLELSTSYYFETMCVESDDIVKEGENILKYTNGTYLTAPYDLVVVSYSVPETETKASSSNYVEVYDMKNLLVSLSISESEISNIELDQEVEISLTSDSSKTYTGKISKIDGIGTYSSSGSTFGVEVSLENDGDIKIGMSVSCTINIEELTDVIAVPISAVQINGNRRYVIVVKNDETKEVDIETGLSNDEYVEIKSGLEEGEIVQVTTTTKQSQIRDDSDNSSSSFGQGGMGDKGGMGGSGGEMMQMPNQENGGMKDSSGSAPTRPNE